MPHELRRYFRRWPLRAVAWPLYYAALVVGFLDGTSAREPVGKLPAGSETARLPLAAVTGPLRCRILLIDARGLVARLIGHTYAVPVRVSVDSFGLRLIPFGDEATDLVQDFLVPTQDVSAVRCERYGWRRVYLHVALVDGSEISIVGRQGIRRFASDITERVLPPR